ncbi:hypothetical protein WJX72_011413 [[Myrmecia] bisecta]|uniref:Aminoglycoside phosphotransferase domain-containing protein n=1 Tax=[Myrmecia] bisecta TaxID=41462 RepID=A0AAW1P149_9CHLO
MEDLALTLEALLQTTRYLADGYSRASLWDLVASPLPYELQSREADLQVYPHPNVPAKLLYKVQEQGQYSVLKFTSQYNELVHHALADEGLAPQLLEPVTQLAGGWYMVSMELLDNPWFTLDALLAEGHPREFDAAIAAVWEALAKAHSVKAGAGKPVWGDARPGNIMLHRRGDGSFEVKFRDFDWAGEEAGMHYPGYLNPQSPGPGCAVSCSHSAET